MPFPDVGGASVFLRQPLPVYAAFHLVKATHTVAVAVTLLR